MTDSGVMSAPQTPPTPHGSQSSHGSNSSVSYRLRPALGVRMLGMACVWLALVVVLEALRRGVPAIDGTLVVALEWIFFAVFVIVVALAAWSRLSGRSGLVLSDEGFVNRTNWRRDSVRSARWSEVADVRRSDGAAGPVFVVALADGRRSLIATRLLDVPVGSLEQQLQSRLNTAHGYRPFN
ncbi:hypothetical protein GCM10009872_31520 [Actinopolymorpha rutila]